MNTTTLPTTLAGLRVYDLHDTGAVLSPSVINDYSTLAIPPYWRAMNFIATNMASFPRSVHKDGAKRAPGTAPHPLDRLIRRRPNAVQNSTIFWRTWFFHAAHKGNGYAEIRRDGMLRPLALLNVCPEDVWPFRYDHGAGPEQYYYIVPDKRVVLAADMLHLQALGYDGMAGMDPVGLHRSTFDRASTLDRFQTRYLQKGTVIRGAVQIPQGVGDEKINEIVATMRTYFQGANAERDVIVLSGGATLNNATLTPQQSQLVEQGGYTTKQIAQITGVPPQFLYEFSESKYNNSIEQMGQDVVRYTFRPWIEQAEDELTLKLLAEDEQEDGFTIRINPGALLRGSTKEQEEIVANSVKNRIRSSNEGRALLDLPPDPDPESDKLHMAGDTAPPPVPAQNSAARPHVDAFAALAPVITAACARVDQKTTKAFNAHGSKTGQDRTVWANVFAGEQATYAAEALQPVSQAIVAIGGRPIDVAKASERYAAAIRARAATGEGKTLSEILTDLGNSN